MKTNIKQFAAAILITIFTAVSIFSIAAKSDTQTSRTYKQFSIHLNDSTGSDDGNFGNDSTDGSGGAGYPPKE